MEKFFEASSQIEIIDTQELLLRRYSNIEYILGLEITEGIEFINKAYEKEIEDKVWEKWLIDYIYMSKDNFISFEEYKKNFIPRNTNVESNLSKEEILKEVEEIERKIALKKRGDS
ncbi:hypothetical protein G6Y98_02560 [Clostridium perfringens]|uniref:hypothetical protein n=1 Tax=Clostridium perfringens TaxID=1502 RepID=UPI0013E2C12A|nr:hypothetical protein [Clostridium perfringens]NGT54729.1 hypothetical protein [Clostridium perfringens]NGT94697.1 hypothetical protein [Clostridium perfringens]